MENSGAIVQITGKEALVLVKPGVFIYVRVSEPYEIGDFISFDNSRIIYKQNRIKKLSHVAALFIGAFILGVLLLMNYNAPSGRILAVVSVDINPSVEFKVSQELKVIGIQPLNDDAKKVLSGLEIMNAELGNAVSRFVIRSSDLGYLKSEQTNYILLSTSLLETGNKKNSIIKQNFKKTLNGITYMNNAGKNISVSWKVLVGSPAQLSAAAKNRLSLGRYILYDNVRKYNASASMEKYRTNSISNLLKAFGKEKQEPVATTAKQITHTPENNSISTPGKSFTPAAPSPSSIEIRTQKRLDTPPDTPVSLPRTTPKITQKPEKPDIKSSPVTTPPPVIQDTGNKNTPVISAFPPVKNPDENSNYSDDGNNTDYGNKDSDGTPDINTDNRDNQTNSPSTQNDGNSASNNNVQQ